mmetsp:Transcript_33088/g.75428  ORF Transcript_33088/g.75428 Transcript_33088/m.75428 type:complete len:303 (-) Transcript_33088:530-1438(-)
MYLERSSGPLTVRKRSRPLVSVAAACTRYVFPQPGGPTSISPRRVRTGALSTRGPYLVGIVSIPSNASFAACMPPTSAHCTSEVKKDWSAIAAGTKPERASSKCRRHKRLGSDARSRQPASASASMHALSTRAQRSATLYPSTRPVQASSAPSAIKVSSAYQSSADFALQSVCNICVRSLTCGCLMLILCSKTPALHKARCTAPSLGMLPINATLAPLHRNSSKRSINCSAKSTDRSSVTERFGAPCSTSGNKAPMSSKNKMLGACQHAICIIALRQCCTLWNFFEGCASLPHAIPSAMMPS